MISEKYDTTVADPAWHVGQLGVWDTPSGKFTFGMLLYI